MKLETINNINLTRVIDLEYLVEELDEIIEILQSKDSLLVSVAHKDTITFSLQDDSRKQLLKEYLKEKEGVVKKLRELGVEV